MFRDKKINDILVWTNFKLSRGIIKYKVPGKNDLKDVDKLELEAFRGLLFHLYVFNSNHENISGIFVT